MVCSRTYTIRKTIELFGGRKPAQDIWSTRFFVFLSFLLKDNHRGRGLLIFADRNTYRTLCRSAHRPHETRKSTFYVLDVPRYSKEVRFYRSSRDDGTISLVCNEFVVL